MFARSYSVTLIQTPWQSRMLTCYFDLKPSCLYWLADCRSPEFFFFFKITELLLWPNKLRTVFQEGLCLSVSPLLRLHNKSEFPIELRFARPNEPKDESAFVTLRSDDTIDESMGLFDAIDLSGGSKRALLSLALGNLVSVLVLWIFPHTHTHYVVATTFLLWIVKKKWYAAYNYYGCLITSFLSDGCYVQPSGTLRKELFI